ncbi:MAG: hypothetical protein OEX77_05735 [Candidatus Bathyarchaeota archaeon]|nr:hypothetical protein [Candidatus Bathyarchaeota archaeon]MDH5732297.1 hypothetical protein [Candidatus Bathyarchaeota archaeon]
MWRRKAGYCEDCAHYRPMIDNCINCYVEKLTRKSHEFKITGTLADSKEATRLASYLQQLGTSFHDKTKKYTA